MRAQKEMLFVWTMLTIKSFLAGLFRAMYDELPAPKKKSRWLFLNLLTRIYISQYILIIEEKGLIIMMTAKVFKKWEKPGSKTSKECRFDTDEVAVNRIGDKLYFLCQRRINGILYASHRYVFGRFYGRWA